MARREITGTTFHGLNSSPNRTSVFELTGNHIVVGDPTRVVSRTSNKEWDGTVTSDLGGGRFRSTVRRVTSKAQSDQGDTKDKPDQPRGTENVSVTVGSGADTSPPASDMTDVFSQP